MIHITINHSYDSRHDFNTPLYVIVMMKSEMESYYDYLGTDQTII